MTNTLPDLQVGNITKTNILATVRLVAQFCVAVHKEYQCLKHEVHTLRAESRSLSERISQSCNATGDAVKVSTMAKLPESGAKNRNDSEFSEKSDSFDSGASGINSGGADENMQSHINNDADASESDGDSQIYADVHVSGVSESSSVKSYENAIADDSDSSDTIVMETQPHENVSSNMKKPLGRPVRIAPSSALAKRRFLESLSDSDQSNANDGSSVINKVCQEISRTLDDNEQSNSSGSSFDKWSPPVLKSSKETATWGGIAFKCKSREMKSSSQVGSDAESGSKTKPNRASKAASSAAKSCDKWKSDKGDNGNETESSRSNNDENDIGKQCKYGSSRGRLRRCMIHSQTTKSKGFFRIKLKPKTPRRNSKRKTAEGKVVGPRKKKLLLERKINGTACNSDSQDNIDDNITQDDVDIEIANSSVVMDCDISHHILSAAKKRHKSNNNQESSQQLPQDLSDESGSGVVIKLWDAGYVWQLSEMLTQMLDEGSAKYLSFSAAKITNHTRLKLAEKLCFRTSFKWDADREIIKTQSSSRPPGARDMEKVICRICLK